ncbi:MULTISPECIES: DUF2536 family protein [Salipaludibacillus]|uniref:DUF2536 family protein n=1 Tax=Salipaludibacillus TaxID=1884449 RepID=UPI001CBA6A36|nr:DUF2536 family protein [Salipaludibacillus neizhouensis]
MIIQSNALRDKVEIFETSSLMDLERKIENKINENQAILLEVHHVSHQLAFNPINGKKIYTATVHFKQLKENTGNK